MSKCNLPHLSCYFYVSTSPLYQMCFLSLPSSFLLHYKQRFFAPKIMQCCCTHLANVSRSRERWNSFEIPAFCPFFQGNSNEFERKIYLQLRWHESASGNEEGGEKKKDQRHRQRHLSLDEWLQWFSIS